MQGPAGEKFAVNVEGSDSVFTLRYVMGSILCASQVIFPVHFLFCFYLEKLSNELVTDTPKIVILEKINQLNNLASAQAFSRKH